MYRNVSVFGLLFITFHCAMATPNTASPAQIPQKKLMLIFSVWDTLEANLGQEVDDFYRNFVRDAASCGVKCHILARDKKGEEFGTDGNPIITYSPLTKFQDIVDALSACLPNNESVSLFIAIIGHASILGKEHKFLLWPGNLARISTFTMTQLQDQLAEIQRNSNPMTTKKVYIVCSTCFSGVVHAIAKNRLNVVTVATTPACMTSLDPLDVGSSFTGVFLRAFIPEQEQEQKSEPRWEPLSFMDAAFAAARKDVANNPGLSHTSSMDFLNTCLKRSEHHRTRSQNSRLERFDDFNQQKRNRDFVPPDSIFKAYMGHPSLLESQWNIDWVTVNNDFLNQEVDAALRGYRPFPELALRYLLCPMIDKEFLNFLKSLATADRKKKGQWFQRVFHFLRPSLNNAGTGNEVLDPLQQRIESYIRENYRKKLQEMEASLGEKKWIDHLKGNLNISEAALIRWFKKEFKAGSSADELYLDFDLDNWVQSLERFIRKRDQFLEKWTKFIIEKSQDAEFLERWEKFVIALSQDVAQPEEPPKEPKEERVLKEFEREYKKLMYSIQPKIRFLSAARTQATEKERQDNLELSKSNAAFTRWLCALMGTFKQIDQLHMFFLIGPSAGDGAEDKERLINLLDQEWEPIR